MWKYLILFIIFFRVVQASTLATLEWGSFPLRKFSCWLLIVAPILTPSNNHKKLFNRTWLFAYSNEGNISIEAVWLKLLSKGPTFLFQPLRSRCRRELRSESTLERPTPASESSSTARLKSSQMTRLVQMTILLGSQFFHPLLASLSPFLRLVFWATHFHADWLPMIVAC